MCARRFLMVVFVLTLLVVAAAFAIYQWGGNVLLRSATPRGHFEAAAAGGPPDYSKNASWVSHPGIADDPSHWAPEGWRGFTAAIAKTATFYVHPTTYLRTDRWNAPLDAGADTDARTRLFVQSQASAFDFNSDVWAPKYRQAAYGAFLLKSADAQEALDLAYSDVRAAFDVFLAAQPKSRPIVLAGHSQGALHLLRLLRERHDQLKGRLVAAYIVGWPVSLTADLPSLGFPACRAKDQSGCVLSWMSFGNPANPTWMLDQWEQSKGPTGLQRRRDDILCVNPLTGTENGSARPGANQGTLVPDAQFRSARLLPGTIGARCSKGLLILDANVPSLGPYVLPGNNYHVYDFALFWASIQGDYVERTAVNWPPS